MGISSPCKRAPCPAGFRDSPASSSIPPVTPRIECSKQDHSCQKHKECAVIPARDGGTQPSRKLKHRVSCAQAESHWAN